MKHIIRDKFNLSFPAFVLAKNNALKHYPLHRTKQCIYQVTKFPLVPLKKPVALFILLLGNVRFFSLEKGTSAVYHFPLVFLQLY